MACIDLGLDTFPKKGIEAVSQYVHPQEDLSGDFKPPSWIPMC